MTLGVESAVAEGLIIEALIAAGITSGRVFSRIAAPGTEEPYTVVQEQDPGQVLGTFDEDEVYITMEFIVKVVMDTGSWADLTEHVKDIHEILQGFTASDPEASIISLVRIGPFSLVEPVTSNGEQYRHLGNRYRARVQ